jgi:hypothetical protein
MKNRPIFAVFALIALLTNACTQHTSYVKADAAALGRVVVYRNGIAYYERKASVDSDKLTMKVPADKVDDFLKSLTVTDAKTGLPLPVSFPAPGHQTADNQVEMTIQLPDKTHRDIVLTYVTEAPAWKPSYRVMVSDAGKVDLQGWAVVDNTSGEDWNAVKVGVGSSSALSFRFDLHSIRLVHRETLQSQDTFAKAPPLGGSLVHSFEDETILAQLDDAEIMREEGHPDVMMETMAASKLPRDSRMRNELAKAEKQNHAMGGLNGAMAAQGFIQRDSPAAAPQAQYKMAGKDEGAAEEKRLRTLADSLKGKKTNVVIEGYANGGEMDANDKALDRANILRNQLIERGVAPAQLQAVARGVVTGQKAGVRLVEQKNTADAAKTPDDNGAPVGESHFESGTPMTVLKGTSAMVSVVQGAANGEVVYLYDAEGTHGDAKYAFRSVRFINPTTSTLETGPVTVYGSGRFIGEGLTDPIPPGATAVVPFALDRQVVVDRDGSTGDRISRLVKLGRGVMTAEVMHAKTTKLKVTNRLGTATTVLIRHNVARGWTIAKSPKVVEKFGDSHLFGMEIGPHESKTIEIEETTPLTRTVDLRTPVGLDLVKVWLDSAKDAPDAVKGLKQVLQFHQDMARATETIESLRERADEYRNRLDELHGQLFSLKAVKTAGPLMTHLQQKMKEMSDKVSAGTLAIVAEQEKLLLSKVKFHDALAELTLDKSQVASAK